MSVLLKLFYLILLCLLVSSCHDATNNHDKNINLDTFSDLRDEKYSLDIVDIREHISKIASEDGVALPMDGFVNKYYKEQQPFLWINRYGKSSRQVPCGCTTRNPPRTPAPSWA